MSTGQIVFAVLLALFLWKAVPFTIVFIIELRRELSIRRLFGSSTYTPLRHYPTRQQADKERDNALDSLAARYKGTKV